MYGGHHTSLINMAGGMRGLQTDIAVSEEVVMVVSEGLVSCKTAFLAVMTERGRAEGRVL